MKRIIPVILGLICSMVASSQTGSVGIGTTSPNSSAALEIASSTKGILIPRMSSVQRNAIPSPAAGLMVYDNTTNSFWYRNAIGWVEISDTANNIWRKSGSNAVVNVSENVGIGNDTPQYHLDIKKPNASIGLTDSETNEFSGSIAGNSKNLFINAQRTLLGQPVPGNLILQNSSGFAASGNVGIGTSSPVYKLDVNGSARVQGNLVVNDGALYAYGSLVVDNGADIVGTTHIIGPAVISDGLSISEGLTVHGGKGIVRSSNGVQLVATFPSGAVGFTNAPPGHTQDVEFVLPDVYSGNPLISVAQVLNQSGNFEHWNLTIHSVDFNTHRFTVRFFNASNSNSTMAATFRFMALGAAL
jgi:hypothetical protein